MTTKLTTHQEDKKRRNQGHKETCSLQDVTHTKAVEYTAGHLVSPSPPPLVSYPPGPVLASTLAELKAISQEFGANILEVPAGTPMILELAGPATVILACPIDEATLEPQRLREVTS